MRGSDRHHWAEGLAALAAALILAAPTAAQSPQCPLAVKVAQANQVNTCRVSSAAELNDLLRSQFKGRIVIPSGADWEMLDRSGQPLIYIPVHSDVQIVGERGPLARRPLLRTEYRGEAYSLFEVQGDHVRIEGLHLRGPKLPADHPNTDRGPDGGVSYVHGIAIVPDTVAGTGHDVTVADNEMDDWSGGAVKVEGAYNTATPEEWDPAIPFPTPADAGQIRVERNYLHHNVMHEGGYGVVVNGGAFVTIEANVFDTNRHAVAAHGSAHSGYVARFNYVLQGGYTQGNAWNQHFDVHGIGDGGYGGLAGTRFEVAYNTIRGEQDYYVTKTRSAWMLRGTPTEGAFFHDNVVVHDDLDEAISLKGHGGLNVRVILPTSQSQFNFQASGNSFDKDYSYEMAAGDFDGDGRSDVFLGNGTAWWYSRGGVRPWELLHISNKRTGDLGFTDIDRDGVTDVLFDAGGGKIAYLKSGTSAPIQLTTAPVGMRDIRIGDFDGDGKPDLFYTRNKQWRVWYGKSRRWEDSQTSDARIGELLFGEFDGRRGTDVVAVRNNAWSYSTASQGSWTKLNDKLTNNFEGALALDVDGKRGTDILVGDGGNYKVSYHGRSKLHRARTGPAYDKIKQLVIGRFDGGVKDELLAFRRGGNDLALWRGPGTDYEGVSEQNMR